MKQDRFRYATVGEEVRRCFGDLFDFNKNKGEAHSRSTDPETSEQAAEHVRGEVANKLEQEVLSALKRHPHGLTSHEIVKATGLTWNTCTPRIRPLIRKGLVIDSGERRKGPTERSCVVWKAT